MAGDYVFPIILAVVAILLTIIYSNNSLYNRFFEPEACRVWKRVIKEFDMLIFDYEYHGAYHFNKVLSDGTVEYTVIWWTDNNEVSVHNDYKCLATRCQKELHRKVLNLLKERYSDYI